MKNLIKGLLLTASVFFFPALTQAEIAVVVHPDHPLASMTPEQVGAVYLGRDSRFEPIDLPESARLRSWFLYTVTGRDALQIKIIWAKMIAKMSPMKVASNSVDAVRRVAANKRAIAYVDERAVDASVKVVMTIQNPELLDGGLRASD
jgi:DNA-binding transcriptional LysR family regulator